ncbi:MAG: D-alanine--D-alanine ligase [Lachnospiraceae bacterium]|nr:D-alanine--D-alanine ligase [Lachnospiraceae bacterium]
MEKQTVAVFFGGQSSEHEISCLSAANVADNINRDRYDVVLVGITKEGEWLFVDSVEAVRSGSWKESTVRTVLSPDASHHGLLILGANGGTEIRRIDVAFPVLHGLYGEDGTIQGLFELAQIPYVGCGVLASAVSMDKLYTKQIVETLGIRQAAYVAVRKEELSCMETVVARVEEKISYPVFVKPCNAGSSRGVTKAENREKLVSGLLEAAEHDRKILVEETIIGREIECAVLGGSEVKASGVGEILAAADFYDYEAKYHNAESKTVVDPNLPEETVEELRRDATLIFRAVDGFGLSRVDFFVTRDGNQVVFNEINTLPGFTAISMYPMLWENRGIAKHQLVEKLIQMAFSRKER